MFADASAVRLRSALGPLPAYVAGRPAPRLDGMATYKLSSNETHLPPLPSVLDAIGRAVAESHRYPDMASTALREAIASARGRTADQVAVGPGSTGVLAQLIQAVCDAGDEVVFAWRSFEAYPILVQLAGAVPVTVPLTAAHEHDLPAMAAAVTERTRLVLLCSPNNPTGTVLGDAAVRAFLRDLPPDVLVVIDEAYGEFVPGPHADGLALQSDFPQVVSLRTFSKAYGLAGLRVGYAIAHPAVAQAAGKTQIPFSVNRAAQAAGVASLAAEDELMARVAGVVRERDHLQAALRDAGWRLPDSGANFVYFPIGAASTAFEEACEAAGLMVRRYGTEGVRVTIGEPEANERFLALAADLVHLQG